MRKITVIVLMLFTALSYAQVGINIATPHTSSALDVTSTSAGFLPPRMTALQRAEIVNPALGLMVFCTNCASGDGELQVYYASGWKNAAGGDITDPKPQIGDYRDGGIVFYIASPPVDLDGDGDLDTGLVCAIQDHPNRIAWILGGSTQTTANGGTSASIGQGQTNTTAMMGQAGYSGGAAAVCNDYSITVNEITYSDWFLPSKDELNQMYEHKAAINSAATATGEGGSNFFDYYYWSSSEFDNDDAWVQLFNDGSQYGSYKYDTSNVRAVRAF
ncbi:DUF1566 domain-containing protein [Flavobacteriaceae bacterium]|nr:DUF1566 domain-containing protein [Flavobacteriaceae bacterium]